MHQIQVQNVDDGHSKSFNLKNVEAFGSAPTHFGSNTAGPLQESVEESIRSQTSSQQFQLGARVKDDSSSAPIVASYPDQIHADPWNRIDVKADKLEDSAQSQHVHSKHTDQSSKGGPSMRRVLNPYGSSDHSGSMKSMGSSSSHHHLSHQ